MSRYRVSNIIWDEPSRNKTYTLGNTVWFDLNDHEIRRAGNVEIALRARLNSFTPGITALLFDYALEEVDINPVWPGPNWLGYQGVSK